MDIHIELAQKQIVIKENIKQFNAVPISKTAPTITET